MASNIAPTETTKTKKMLKDLPAEIHELIVSSLDYFPLTNLCQTNHYFHNLVTREHIKQALLDLERRAVGEGRPLDSFKEHLLEGQWTLISTHLPCYKCLLALPTKRYFLTSQKTGHFALGGSAASRRRCGGCYYKERAKWLIESELFFTEGNTWIDCVRCKKTKRFVERTELDWSNLAWTRGRCCFNCYWADCGDKNGEIRLVPYELEGLRKALIEVPIKREELKHILNFQKHDLPDREAP